MIVSPYLERLSLNHQYQGTSNDCGPCCSAMVINTFTDSSFTGTSIGRSMEKIRWKYMLPFPGKFKKWATFPWGIKNTLQENGIKSQWLCFQKASKLVHLLLQDTILVALLGNFFPTWAHYKILVAYDFEQGYGFIDPAFPTSDVYWDSSEIFTKQWRLFGNQVICAFPEHPLANWRGRLR